MSGWEAEDSRQEVSVLSVRWGLEGRGLPTWGLPRGAAHGGSQLSPGDGGSLELASPTPAAQLPPHPS